MKALTDNNKYHWYVAVMRIDFDMMVTNDQGETGRSGQARHKIMNLVMQLKKKNITQADLNNLQKASLHRMENEFGIVPPNFVFLDCLFLGSTYLGVMDKQEFLWEEPKVQEPIEQLPLN